MTLKTWPLPKARLMRRKGGFTDHVQGVWYLSRRVGDMTTFNLYILKKSGEYKTEVLNEYTGQPEPYGEMIPVYRNSIVANIEVILHELERDLGLVIKHDHSEYGVKNGKSD